MSWGSFKAAANDVGGWLWDTAKSGFNEKQTIGQIVTDAVISMFLIAGEVTAARDAVASSPRLAQQLDKREEALEWAALVPAPANGETPATKMARFPEEVGLRHLGVTSQAAIATGNAIA